jgi:hypothetical protein
MTRTSPPVTEKDLQRLGQQIFSLAGVVVVAAVQFGIPITPEQQASILSVLFYAWAAGSTIYGLRHRSNIRKTTPRPTGPAHSARKPLAAPSNGNGRPTRKSGTINTSQENTDPATPGRT